MNTNFWDMTAKFYDFFEEAYNGNVYHETGVIAAEEIVRGDIVLECACGTGAISRHLAPKCGLLYATDMSDKMLKECAHNCRKFPNVRVRKMDMTHIPAGDSRFDKVVAGNVIHLLDDPEAAVKELLRVCRKGGKVIIPTYINMQQSNSKVLTDVFSKAGAGFRRQFDLDSYEQFFIDMGIKNFTVKVAEGKIPCAITVINN